VTFAGYGQIGQEGHRPATANINRDAITFQTEWTEQE
jgi:hypothetical protein